MNASDLEILLNTGNFRERPPEYALRLLEDTCARTGLDWKARHVYLMQRAGKWGVTLSIDGFRMIGAQDASYVGQEGPFWTTGPDGTWTDIPPERAPYAAKVGIRKRDGTVTWGVAKFTDYKAGPMWDKFSSTMTAKCAEMLAWRKALPGKLGGLYGTEEMAQAEKGAVGTKVEEVVSEDALGMWLGKLEGAEDLASLKAIGADISKAQLSTDLVQKLHEVYNRQKSKYI